MPLALRFSNRILIIGCGSIGQGLLPLLLDTFAIDSSQLAVISADENGRQVASQFGIRYLVHPLTPDNYQTLLATHLKTGDLLLNLAVNVSSIALIAWCKTNNVLYLDTCVEPWDGGYCAHDTTSLETTNAWLRQQALAMHTAGTATAVIAHGMNPGLVSHLLKEALLALAYSKGIVPTHEWGTLAQTLGVQAIHIAERDTQDDGLPLSRGIFANTWSAHGLYSEACLQRAELGWGSHETTLPPGALVVAQNNVQSMCLTDPGAEIWLKSWSPSQGEQRGMLVSHHEVVSISALLTTNTYRPTVCYVYRPCPKARTSLANWRAGHPIRDFQVLAGKGLNGIDEIGILLVHDTGALWHGSILDCADARRLAPHNSATTLPVVAGILGAMVWMLDHPREGVVEAESMDSGQVLAVARPYLGRIATLATDWRPGVHLGFGEFLAQEDKHETAVPGYSRAQNNTQEAVA